MKIIFDLSFQSHMRTKVCKFLKFLYYHKQDIKSLAAQIAICYNLNKKIEKPFSFNVCSYIDEAKEQLDIMGSKSWKVLFINKHKYLY